MPAAESGAQANRCLYLTAGESVEIGGRQVEKGYFAKLEAGLPAVVSATGSSGVELLMLQGKPIGEPVAQHGPFVMNTRCVRVARAGTHLVLRRALHALFVLQAGSAVSRSGWVGGSHTRLRAEIFGPFDSLVLACACSALALSVCACVCVL